MHGAKFLFPRGIARRSRNACLRVWRDSAGATAVEFAMIAPVMILMFICMADLGIGVYTDMQVNNAAQYGAEYALVKGFDSSAISSAVRSSTSLSSANVSPTQFCGCPSSSGVVSSSCNSTCSDGTKAGSFAQVAVSDTYTTMISYPGLPSSFNLTAQSTVRLQ
jgi:Flp pilus assembly protein TadG